MYSKAGKPVVATLALAIIGLLGSVASCWGEPVNTAGRYHVETALVAGKGINDTRLVTTSDGSQIKISGGGGLGARLSLGYGLSPSWDVDLGAEYKNSNNDQSSTSAKVSFTRYPILATVKYKIPVASIGQVKIGAGPGLYVGGKLDADFTPVSLPHEVITFKPALGGHVSTEWETILDDWSFTFGVRYYYVSYRADSATINGASVPTSILGSQLRDFDGSAFEFIVGFGRYF